MSTTSTLQPTTQKPEAQKQTPGFWRGLVNTTGGTIFGLALLSSAVAAGTLAGLAVSFRNLPDVRGLKSFAPSQTSYIYDAKGRELQSLHGEEHREIVALNQIFPPPETGCIGDRRQQFLYAQWH